MILPIRSMEWTGSVGFDDKAAVFDVPRRTRRVAEASD